MTFPFFRPYLLAYRNRFRDPDRSRQNAKRDLLLLLIALITMVAIYAGFKMIFRTISGDALFQVLIPGKIVELLFYAYFILLVVSNTVSAVGNIFVAENMDLFLSTPTSNSKLYLAKFLETLIETSVMFFVFSVPAGLAYYSSLETKPGFILASLVVTIPFLIIPTGLGIALATIFVRLAASVWRRGSFLLICILALGAWGLTALVRILDKVEMKKDAPNAFVQLVGIFDNPNPAWFPSRWAADLINGFIAADPALVFEKSVLLAASSIASFALGFLFFDLFALRVRSTANLQQKTKKSSFSGRGRDFVRVFLETCCRILPIEQQNHAVILKDLTTLFRNRAQSLQLLLFLGIAVTYVVIFKYTSLALDLAPIAAQAWKAFLISINLLFAGFILTAVMTRLVYPSVSLEGKAFWILQVSPIEIRRLVIAKFWCWLPISAGIALTLLMAGILAIGFSPLSAIFTLVTGLSLSVGCTGIAIGLGATFASFEWESPNQISVGLGTLVLLLASLSMVLLQSIPSSGLTFLILVPKARENLGFFTSQALIGVAVFSIVWLNLAVAHVSVKLGSQALKKRSLGQ